MNSRFKNLQQEFNHPDRQQPKQSKQLPKNDSTNYFKSLKNTENKKNKINNQNIFVQQKKKTNTKEFNIEEESFPTLNNKQIIDNTEKENYIIKIKQQKKIVEPKQEAIPIGWTIIKFDKTNNKIIYIDRRTISNKAIENTRLKQEHKQKKYIGNLILNNRFKSREDLNNILGDISPYWNTKYIYNNDDSDDYYDYDNNTSESDNDYYED